MIVSSPIYQEKTNYQLILNFSKWVWTVKVNFQILKSDIDIAQQYFKCDKSKTKLRPTMSRYSTMKTPTLMFRSMYSQDQCKTDNSVMKCVYAGGECHYVNVRYFCRCYLTGDTDKPITLVCVKWYTSTGTFHGLPVVRLLPSSHESNQYQQFVVVERFALENIVALPRYPHRNTEKNKEYVMATTNVVIATDENDEVDELQ